MRQTIAFRHEASLNGTDMISIVACGIKYDVVRSVRDHDPESVASHRNIFQEFTHRKNSKKFTSPVKLGFLSVFFVASFRGFVEDFC